MELYKFFHNEKNLVMLSTDKDGGNLPGEAQDWRYQKAIEFERGGPEHIGFPNDQILDSIEKIGYFPPEPSV
ncbi:MAG: hypothetical protein Salg2KO_21060 [Salibacteraceae bacterium]